MSDKRNRTTTLATVVVSALLVAVVVPMASASAQAQPAGDPQAQRAEIRSQRAELASQIDTMSADGAQIDAALADLEANVQGQQSLVANAQAAYSDADRRANEAEAHAAERQADVSRLEAQLAVVAVDSYVNPPGQEFLDRLKAKTATEAAQKQALIGVQASRTGDVIDQLRSAKYALERERETAEDARTEAKRQEEEAGQRLAELGAAMAQQQEFAASLEARLNAKLAEAQVLAEFDRELAAQMMAEQEALAAKIRSIPAPPPESTPTPSPIDPGTPPPSGPTPPAGPTPTTPTPTTPPPVVPPPVLPPTPGTTWVRGIQVATSIAGQFEAMLSAAANDGFVLSGYGYRDISAQIALRRQNCGTSEYAIYSMPASGCSPPTAIPGTSMHERGLAIDFRWNGASISTQSNPAFQWLAGHAGAYGFCNLPGEPWHWSTTCR